MLPKHTEKISQLKDMDGKRRSLPKGHPARDTVIDLTDLTSDTDKSRPLSVRPLWKDKTAIRSSAGLPTNRDIKPNLGYSPSDDRKRLSTERSSSKGSSRPEAIQVDDSEDEALPQVHLALGNTTPPNRTIRALTSAGRADIRPSCHQMSRFPPTLSSKGTSKQKHITRLPNVSSQPSPSGLRVSSIEATSKAPHAKVPMNDKLIDSASFKQKTPDRTTMHKTTPKPLTYPRAASTTSLDARSATIEAPDLITNAHTAEKPVKASLKGADITNNITSVVPGLTAEGATAKNAKPASHASTTDLQASNPIAGPRAAQMQAAKEGSTKTSDVVVMAQVQQPSKAAQSTSKLSKSARKTIMSSSTTRPAKEVSAHMLKSTNRPTSRRSTSRESPSQFEKHKPRSSIIAEPPTFQNTSNKKLSSIAKSIVRPVALMPPKCRALPDDSTSTRYGSDSLAASKAEAVHKETNTNPEPEPVHNNTHGTKEDSEESMDEPHNSIEVEVATVVKNQLDLYKIEHQELTKKLLNQEILRRRHGQLKEKAITTTFSFRTSKGIPIPINRKVPSSAPVRQLLEGKLDSAISYRSNVTALPDFMVHIPLLSSYLSENAQRLNTESYIAGLDDDEELINELQSGYRIDSFFDRERNGHAKHRAEYLSSYVKAAFEQLHLNAGKMLKYLLDYQHAVEWIPKETLHYVIKDGSLRRKWATLTRTLPELSEEDIETANKICQTFYDSEHTSIWYLVNHLFEAVKKLPRPPSSHDAQLWTKYRCRVCHVHHCFEHGALLETKLKKSDLDSCPTDDEYDPDGSWSDDEDPASINQALIVRPRITGTYQKQTLAYSTRAILAIDQTKDTSCLSDEPTSLSEADASICSETCFLLKQNRLSIPDTAWNDAENRDFKQLLAKYVSSDRGSCFISMVMDKPCVEVFRKMLPESFVAVEPEATVVMPPLPKKPWYFFKEPRIPNHRRLFIPCNHVGECVKTNCSCVQNNVTCEKTCACSSGCARQFQGCTCKRQGRICWQDKECSCFRFNRECDQDLCGTCGADEALDPLNRDRVLQDVCTNVHLQKGNSKRTLVGISEIAGFGLFMAEKVKAGDFVGEYKGQITSSKESDRRGLFYAHCAAFYEFKANPGKIMDGTKAGNLTRFINHAQRAEVINLGVKLLICNTVVRLGFCATRDIEPGEELFFDYGVEEHNDERLLEKRDGELVPVGPRKLGKVVRTKVKRSHKDKKQHGSIELNVLDAVVGSSLDVEVFSSRREAESDVDPMELDITLPVEDPDDVDYVDNDDDDDDVIEQQIPQRRMAGNHASHSEASGSPAGSFNIRRSARHSVSRPPSPICSPSRGLKRKRESRSDPA